MTTEARPVSRPHSGGGWTTTYPGEAPRLFPYVPGRRLDRTADQVSELNNLMNDHWQDIHDITDPRLRKHWKAAQVALARISSRLRWLADQERRG